MCRVWYDLVGPDVPLTQGDLVFDCPVLAWKEEPIAIASEAEAAERLSHHFDTLAVDVVIMTQACDLEQENIRNVTLCRLWSLTEYREQWTENRKGTGRRYGKEAWRNYCGYMKRGFIWNVAMLNQAHVHDEQIEHRIVDFYEVYTLPLEFLRWFAQQAAQPRFRLLPPYREHLSQAFARFYMRVGLPAEIADIW